MPHAYVCARDDYVVLMDIERGKYLAVDGRQSRELSELISIAHIGTPYSLGTGLSLA
jgi:hypothetical protein